MERIIHIFMLYQNFLPEIQDDATFEEYKQFIQENSLPDTSDGICVERHHIIPKVFLPKELHNDLRNIVILSPYNHLQAHRLLSLAVRSRYTNYAYWCMINEYRSRAHVGVEDTVDELEYNRIRSIIAREASECRKGKEFTDKHRENLSKAHKGYVTPQETKDKISASNKGKIKGLEWRENLSKSCKGRVGSCFGKVFIHLGEEKELRVYPEEVKNYIELGWERGRKSYKHRSGITSTSVWITKEQINKIVDCQDVSKWLADGWRIGKYRRSSAEIQQEKETRKRVSDMIKKNGIKRWEDIE